MRFGLVFVIYIVVGLLVAAGIIGDEPDYFSNLDDIEEIIEMVLAVLLWPLVLLGVDLNISGGDSGKGGGDSPQGAGGDGAGSGGSGGKDGGSGGKG
jgi:hypothetical protein